MARKPGKEENLRKFTSETGRECGKKSGEVRRKANTFRKMLECYLSMPAKSLSAFNDLAKKYGLVNECSAKEAFLFASLVGEIEKGLSLKSVETLIKILGEPMSVEIESETQQKQVELLEAIEKVISNAN